MYENLTNVKFLKIIFNVISFFCSLFKNLLIICAILAYIYLLIIINKGTSNYSGIGIGILINLDIPNNPFSSINMPALLVLYLIIGAMSFYILLVIKQLKLLYVILSTYIILAYKFVYSAGETVEFKYFTVFTIRSFDQKIDFLKKINDNLVSHLKLSNVELNYLCDNVNNYEDAFKQFLLEVEKKRQQYEEFLRQVSNKMVQEDLSDYTNLWYTIGFIVMVFVGFQIFQYLRDLNPSQDNIYDIHESLTSSAWMRFIESAELDPWQVSFISEDLFNLLTSTGGNVVGYNALPQLFISLLSSINLDPNVELLRRLSSEDLNHFYSVFRISSTEAANNITNITRQLGRNLSQEEYINLFTRAFLNSFSRWMTYYANNRYYTYIVQLFGDIINLPRT